MSMHTSGYTASLQEWNRNFRITAMEGSAAPG